HVLDGVPADHPCARLHGHNWTVTLYLAAEEVDARGFVVDFFDLTPFRRMLDERFDHRHLNDVVDFSPTSENLARHLHDAARADWPEGRGCAGSEPPRPCAADAPGPALVLPGCPPWAPAPRPRRTPPRGRPRGRCWSARSSGRRCRERGRRRVAAAASSGSGA